MNIFKKIILVSTLAISASVFAHSDGHGKINAAKAIEIAQTSAKMLTFKAHGMSVGKINKSWENVKKSQFEIVKKNEASYIVKATNMKEKEVLFFTISKKGEVKDVIDGRSFNQGHGHSH